MPSETLVDAAAETRERKSPLTATHARCDSAVLREFAVRWSVKRIWIYGSAVRDDFRDDSDIDVICDFSGDSLWFYENSPGSTIDFRGRCGMELSEVFGRDADILGAEQIGEDRNHIKRQIIWDEAVLVYAI